MSSKPDFIGCIAARICAVDAAKTPPMAPPSKHFLLLTGSPVRLLPWSGLCSLFRSLITAGRSVVTLLISALEFRTR